MGPQLRDFRTSVLIRPHPFSAFSPRVANSIEATRKSLPVYTLREELLAAIAEHQILIIVSSPRFCH